MAEDNSQWRSETPLMKLALDVNVQLFLFASILTITGGHLCMKARIWCDIIYNTDNSFDTIKVYTCTVILK